MIVLSMDTLALNKAVAVICCELQRETRLSLVPNTVKKTLEADINDNGSHVPTVHECQVFVSAVIEGHEPAWFAERWPRTLGLLASSIKNN